MRRAYFIRVTSWPWRPGNQWNQLDTLVCDWHCSGFGKKIWLTWILSLKSAHNNTTMNKKTKFLIFFKPMHFDKVMSSFYNRKIKAAIFVTFETHWSFPFVCLFSKICVVLIEQLNEQGGVCFALTNPHFIAAIWRLHFQPLGSAALFYVGDLFNHVQILLYLWQHKSTGFSRSGTHVSLLKMWFITRWVFRALSS